MGGCFSFGSLLWINEASTALETNSRIMEFSGSVYRLSDKSINALDELLIVISKRVSDFGMKLLDDCTVLINILKLTKLKLDLLVCYHAIWLSALSRYRLKQYPLLLLAGNWMEKRYLLFYVFGIVATHKSKFE